MSPGWTSIGDYPDWWRATLATPGPRSSSIPGRDVAFLPGADERENELDDA